MRLLLLWIVTTFGIITTTAAQKKAPKFGDIKAADFEPTAYAPDSSAGGVVLFDYGSVEYEGSNDAGLAIVSTRHTRIRLLNRNAFDLATFNIQLFSSNNYEEKLESLEAVTYTLQNGKINTTKLDKSSLFKERYNKYLILSKFTLPNISEGCIIEVKYKTISPYEQYISPWYFQGRYPVLYSEFKATIPNVYRFLILPHGFHPFKDKVVSSDNVQYNILVPGGAGERSQMTNYSGIASVYLWSMENIPAVKPESYITAVGNYISRLEFILSSVQYPNQNTKLLLGNWYSMAERLMEDEDFGGTLNRNNGWMNDVLKPLVGGLKDTMEIARKIFYYVRDNVACTANSAKYLSAPLKKILDTKHGNVADVNLLLTGLLLKAGINAYPVMLSTRDHGWPMEEYPLLDKMNYVVSATYINGRRYLLDASESRLGFGYLPLRCYNGFARIIDPMNPVLIDLSPDSLREKKVTTLFISNAGAGEMKGVFNSSLGNLASHSLRSKLTRTSVEDYFKEARKQYSFEIDLTGSHIDSLNNHEVPATVGYDFTFKLDDDIVYLNPMLDDAYKENPFKAAERFYPVEMPFALNETFVLNMEIPKGYKVDEVPKSARVKFNDNEGLFEYMIAQDETRIQFRSTLRLNKATFMPEDYEDLRNFFAYVVRKHSEQIVLKKIN